MHKMSPLRLFGSSPLKTSQGGSAPDSVENEAPGRVPLCPIDSSTPHGNRGKRAQFNPLSENGNGTPDKRAAFPRANKFGWPQQQPQQHVKSQNTADQSRDEEEQLEHIGTPRALGLQSLQPGSKQSGGSQYSTPRASRIENKHWQMLSEPGNQHSVDNGGNGTPRRGVSRSLKYNQDSALMRAPKPQVKQTFENSTQNHHDLVGDSAFWEDHNVQVLIRIRPLSSAEVGQGRSLRQDTAHSLTWVGPPESRFTFDHVACETISQEKLFMVAGLPMVENCISGYNNCMFAYGQTGSGKTHTMLGDIAELDQKQSEDRGMIPRVFEYLFEKIRKEEQSRTSENLKFVCKCSFLEIYNEQITDLLEPTSTNLQLREDGKKGVYVENLTEVEVQNLRDVVSLLLQGSASRKVAATNMNRESSRSHSVFTCVVESKWERNSVINTRFGRLNLVDLAGSERQKSSGAEGDRLREAANINKSLSTLGLVIMVLVDAANGKPRHIPYRDSKLTFLLQDSLGGNSKTLMIATISPSNSCALETLSTLKFAQRAKFIRNNAVVNEDTFGDVVALRQQIQLLKEELNYYQTRGFPKRLAPERTEEDMDSTILSRLGQDILAGSLRREAAAESVIKNMAVEMEHLNKLVKQREEDTQRVKMVLRFREDKIRRMEGITEGLLSADEYLLDEKNALLEEIKLLRSRVDHNPEVTRFAMENIRLMHELKRLQEFTENSEMELMSMEVANLRDQLLELLKLTPSREDHTRLLRENEELRSEASKWKALADERSCTLGKNIQELEEHLHRQRKESSSLKEELDLANHKLFELEAEEQAHISMINGLKDLLQQSEDARAVEETKSTELQLQLAEALNSVKVLDASLKEEAGLHEEQGLLLMKELELLQNERSDAAFVMLKYFSDATEELKSQLTATQQESHQYRTKLLTAETSCASMVDALKLADTHSSKLREELAMLQISLDQLAADSLGRTAEDRQQIEKLTTISEVQATELSALRDELYRVEAAAETCEAEVHGMKQVVQDRCSEFASSALSLSAEELSSIRSFREELLSCRQEALNRVHLAEANKEAMQSELLSLGGVCKALQEALTQTETRERGDMAMMETVITELRNSASVKEQQIEQLNARAEGLQACLAAAEEKVKRAESTIQDCAVSDTAAMNLLASQVQEVQKAMGFLADFSQMFCSETLSGISIFKVGFSNILDGFRKDMLEGARDAATHFKVQEQEYEIERTIFLEAIQIAESRTVQWELKDAEISLECKHLEAALEQSRRQEASILAVKEAAEASAEELRVCKLEYEREIEELKSILGVLQLKDTELSLQYNNMKAALEQARREEQELVLQKEAAEASVEMLHHCRIADQEEIEKLKSVVGTLQADLTAAEGRAKQAESRVGECLEAQSAATILLAYLEREVQNAKRSLEDSKVGIGSILEDVKRDMVQSAQSALKHIKTDLTLSSKQASVLESELVSTKNALDAAVAAELKSAAEVTDMKLNFKLLEQEADSERASFMQKLSDYQNRNSCLEVTLQQLADQVTSLELENNSLMKDKAAKAALFASVQEKVVQHADAEERLQASLDEALETKAESDGSILKLQEELEAKIHEVEEKQRIIESLDQEMLELSSLVEEKLSQSVRDLNLATRERDQLQAELLVLSEQLEMAQAAADEREQVAREARQVAEASKAYAEEKEEEVRVLERSVGELESTVNALENQVGIIKREAQIQRLLREDLELQVQTLKHQVVMKETNASNYSEEESVLTLKEEIAKLSEDCMEKDAQIQGYKKHICDLMTSSTRQTAQHQQRITELESVIDQARSAKAKGSNSPFKCLVLSQQINSEMDEELSAARRRISELESSVSARQTEVYMLNSRLAEAESMTHDVVRDLLGVKMDITNYTSLLTSQNTAAKLEETEACQLRKRLDDFAAERESLLQELNEQRAELASVRAVADGLSKRDQQLAAENEKLRDENSAVKKHQQELQSEIKKLSGQQNLHQRIHHHAKIKDENNALKVQNEELCLKIKRLESRLNRFDPSERL